MASQGGRAVDSDGNEIFAPAEVKLLSEGRHTMNVRINNIFGSVTVGCKNVINVDKRETSVNIGPTVYHTEHHTVYDTDSSSSDSDSDSDASRFFRKQGTTKPTKKGFQRMAGERGPANTVIIDNDGNGPRYYDKHGQRAPFPQAPSSTTATTTPTTTTTRTSTSRNSQVPDQTPRLSKYEQQTQEFNRIMREIRQPQQIIDENIMRKIAPHFGAGWRRVFRHLDIHDSLIDIVHQETGAVQDAVFKLLVKWSRRCNNPDLRTLLEAVVRAEQMQLVKAIRDACATWPDGVQ